MLNVKDYSFFIKKGFITFLMVRYWENNKK